jgi:altronate dehydratase small subunit
MGEAYLVNVADNVVTALELIEEGTIELIGIKKGEILFASQQVAQGHKIALCNIRKGDSIIKYGGKIGAATQDITKSQWGHLHNMKSCYDERSSNIDAVTGRVLKQKEKKIWIKWYYSCLKMSFLSVKAEILGHKEYYIPYKYQKVESLRKRCD